MAEVAERTEEEVVRTVLGGQFISSIAEDLGTTPALVRKWWLKLWPEGYNLPRADEPFAELRIIDDGSDLAGSLVLSSSRGASH